MDFTAPQIEDWAAASNVNEVMKNAANAAIAASLPLSTFVDINNPPPNIHEWGSGGSPWRS